MEQAQRDLDDLDDCEWYLLDRDTSMGFVSYSMDADRMGNLASVFPLIFFLVAALVCLTTMTRMVEEQRITIGGMKALATPTPALQASTCSMPLLPACWAAWPVWWWAFWYSPALSGTPIS